MIEHVKVTDSSAVTDILFNDHDNALVVQTTNGKRYTFFNQSRVVYENFLNSESKGKFFNRLMMQTKRQ